MVSLHHVFDLFSILGMLVGVILMPILILGTLFLIVRAAVGM
jgi:hypothetical protein